MQKIKLQHSSTLFVTLLALASQAGAATQATPKAAPPKPAPAPAATAAPAQTQASPASKPAAALSAEDQEFFAKLQELLVKTDSSIDLLRKQITASTNAPFLADLYQQLAELLIQKSNSLYFLKSERASRSGMVDPTLRQDRQVIQTQKEAITVFDRVLRDFPSYEKRPKTLFMLAATLRAVDDVPRFIQTVQELVKKHPEAIETYRARLLMGQHLYERKIFDEAVTYLDVVRRSAFMFEKNLAKYRLGLVYLEMNKPVESLRAFEEVIADPELEKVSLDIESKTLLADKKSENLKREALLDSIRVYTVVYAKNPKPVEFYLKIAPSEPLFQEVIEKLAHRYVILKQYNLAIELLRALSERIGDPERVLNIYKDVLVAVPPKDRITIPPEEMVRVLQLFNQWMYYFNIQRDVLTKAYQFFEAQVRDLGTRNHEAAKLEADAKNKQEYYRKAREYYLMYLRFFQKTKNSVRIATNLCDVYFNQKDFLNSGELYFRVFQGEFGATNEKPELIKNTIFSLQQRREYTYYEQMRVRGLLIKSIQTYMDFDKRQQSEPKLNFVYLKTVYEQGFYDTAIPKLYKFLEQNRNTKFVSDAADLILDYYNTQNDMKGLTQAAAKILAMNLPDPVLNGRIKSIQMTAKFKRVEQKVIQAVGYGGNAEGKEYLQAALSSGDASLMDAALKQALSASKMSRDIETFFKTASLMVSKEPNAEKRSGLLNSIVAENIRLTRFVTASGLLNDLVQRSQDSATRSKAFSERARIAIMMRDVVVLSDMADNPLWSSLEADLKKRGGTLCAELLNSGIPIPANLLHRVVSDGLADEPVLLAMYRARDRLTGGLGQTLSSAIQKQCSGGSSAAICRWGKIDSTDAQVDRFIQGLNVAPLTVQSVEVKAQEFVQADGLYRALDSSGDPYLDIYVAVKSYQLYQRFADFLGRVGQKNPELKAVLDGKVRESQDASQKYLQSCSNIASSTGLMTTAGRYCNGKTALNSTAYFRKSSRPAGPRVTSDPKNAKIAELQKKLFVDDNKAASLLDIARQYQAVGAHQLAVGTASYALSLNQEPADEFKIVLGCSLIPLGFFSEAQYQLSNSKSSSAQRQQCLQQAKGML